MKTDVMRWRKKEERNNRYHKKDSGGKTGGSTGMERRWKKRKKVRKGGGRDRNIVRQRNRKEKHFQNNGENGGSVGMERGRKKEKKWGRKTKMLGEKMDRVPKKERAKRTTEKKGRRQKLWMKQGKTNYEGKIKRQERETEGKEKRKEWKEWPPFLSPRHPLTLRPPYFPPRPFFSLPPPSALSTFISETFDTRMTPLPLALLKVKFNASSQTQKRRRRSVFCSHRGRVSQFNQKEGLENDKTGFKKTVWVVSTCRMEPMFRPDQLTSSILQPQDGAC